MLSFKMKMFLLTQVTKLSYKNIQTQLPKNVAAALQLSIKEVIN